VPVIPLALAGSGAASSAGRTAGDAPSVPPVLVAASKSSPARRSPGAAMAEALQAQVLALRGDWR
jgi:hypothetical protein